MKKLRHSSSCAVGGILLVFVPAVALAQAAAPPPPAAPPAAPAAGAVAPATPQAMPAPSPATAAAPAPAPAEATAATPPPPVAAAPMPAPGAAAATPPPAASADVAVMATKEAEKPKVNIGVWLRTGLTFQNPNRPTKFDDQALSAYGELHLDGHIYESVNYTFNFVAQYSGQDLTGTARILDAIAQFDALDEFHIWAGHMLVPSDRSNFSGPFFMSPWNYPGVFSVPGQGFALIFPAEGPIGRNTGATIWGDFGKGLFKYYAGAYSLADVGQSPLYSGRLNFSPIGKEPGYYHSSTYYGDKDVLALGVGAQFQKHGSVGPVPVDAAGVPTGPAPTDDFSDINADILAEFKVGDSVLTGEGAVYHFAGNYNANNVVPNGAPNPADNAFFLLGSYLSPQVGIGKIQPLIRYQWAKQKTPDLKMYVVDADLSYVVKEYSLRGVVGYQFTNMGAGRKGDSIHIGVQLMTL